MVRRGIYYHELTHGNIFVASLRRKNGVGHNLRVAVCEGFVALFEANQLTQPAFSNGHDATWTLHVFGNEIVQRSKIGGWPSPKLFKLGRACWVAADRGIQIY